MAEARTALVTGASRGIGKAIAAALAAAGHRVLGTATSAAGAARISEALGKQGQGLALDLASPESCEALLKEIAAEAPLILVNNAAITRDNLLLRMKADEWTEVLATNLSGVHRITQGLVRGMVKARWGRIVNLASVVGAMGNAGQANYAATKAGLAGYSKSLAAELGSRGVTVNCVSPGFIETDMTLALDESQRQAMLDRIPLGRFGAAEEVAQLVAFLASEAAGYITGETIHINGGIYMN